MPRGGAILSLKDCQAATPQGAALAREAIGVVRDAGGT